MNKIVVLFSLWLFAASNAFGQDQDLIPTEEEALLECIVTDPDKIPEEDTELIIESEDKTFSKTGTTDIDGRFKILLPEGKKYHIKVKKFGQFAHYDVDIPVHDGAVEFLQPLIIVTVKSYIREYTLNHLYFDSNKWDILPEAHHTLNKLYHGFIKNPKLVVEIAGHTDNRGDDSANLRLSQRRADAIRKYLIDKGISGDRILAKGYGEANPHSDNNTPEGRSKNRRTEVKVINE